MAPFHWSKIPQKTLPLPFALHLKTPTPHAGGGEFSTPPSLSPTKCGDIDHSERLDMARFRALDYTLVIIFMYDFRLLG